MTQGALGGGLTVSGIEGAYRDRVVSSTHTGMSAFCSLIIVAMEISKKAIERAANEVYSAHRGVHRGVQRQLPSWWWSVWRLKDAQVNWGGGGIIG